MEQGVEPRASESEEQPLQRPLRRPAAPPASGSVADEE